MGIKINVTGDFYVNPSSISDFLSESFVNDDVINFFNDSDLNITNLEAPVVSKETPSDKYGPNLFMNEKSLSLLKKLNFDVVTLANNHIMDQGNAGLTSTIEALEKHNIKHVGANINVTEASKPLITEINGIKIGILNIAENEFSNTTGDFPGAAPLDIMSNTLSLQSLKKRVDKIILIVHGGAEMHKHASPRFFKTLRYFADQGADAIIAHHTHRYNGCDIYKGVPIVYGTGNFIFSKKNSDFNWNLGVVAQLSIEKNDPIRLTTIPLLVDQNSSTTLSFLNSDNQLIFDEIQAENEKVLNDENLLEKEYSLFVKKVENQYRHFLQPYKSKYLHKLFSMGILPDFLKKKRKRLLYLNLIRCEAHRDVLLRLLKD